MADSWQVISRWYSLLMTPAKQEYVIRFVLELFYVRVVNVEMQTLFGLCKISIFEKQICCIAT